jgi:hypothetical protein
MIYEIRTYKLKPGSLGEVEKRFGEAYEYRKKYSPLTAFWHSEIGPLNQIIHVWPYPNLGERDRIRADAAKDANWPPKIQEFVLDQQVEVLVPFPFVPEVMPGKVGPVFEMRRYSIKAGTVPDLKKRWEPAIPARIKLSPLVMAGTCEFGQANLFIHVWAYSSMDQRMAIREEARKTGVWPPPGGGGDSLLAQENKILLPSSFSPLQ